MNWFRWQGSSLYLQLYIQPGARQSEFAGLHAGRLKLKIHAPPVDGKANAELIEFMSQQFRVGKTSITLIHGALGRNKTICIATVSDIPFALRDLGLLLD